MDFYFNEMVFTVTKTTLSAILIAEPKLLVDGEIVNGADDSHGFFESLINSDIITDDEKMICAWLKDAPDFCPEEDSDIILDNMKFVRDNKNTIASFYSEWSNSIEDDFEIVKILGKGKSSIIYRIKFPSREESVVLKVSIPDVSDKHLTAAKNELFIMEKFKSCKYVPKLITEHVLLERIISLYEQPEGFSSLENYSFNGDYRMLGTIITNLVKGLEDIHKHDVAHRDIKLENVLYNKDGEVIYIDFDLSCSKDKVIDTERLYGTYSYYDPLLLINKDYTYDDLVISDYWSLGILILRLFGLRMTEVAYGYYPHVEKINEYINNFDKIMEPINSKIWGHTAGLLCNGFKFNLLDLLTVKRNDRKLRVNDPNLLSYEVDDTTIVEIEEDKH